jgi:hypothetical protein
VCASSRGAVKKMTKTTYICRSKKIKDKTATHYFYHYSLALFLFLLLFYLGRFSTREFKNTETKFPGVGSKKSHP